MTKLIHRLPAWLRKPLPNNEFILTEQSMRDGRLFTVCEEASCPNQAECWSKKTATFLALGSQCTRNCGFCNIDFSNKPKAPDIEEPLHISNAVLQLQLKHVVITMVSRDDLDDGGAAHILEIMRSIRKSSNATIEILVSDFQGSKASLDILLSEPPEIFNHNIETVRRLTNVVRHKATYDRSLNVLKYIKNNNSNIIIKSGIMVGLGESESEVHQTMIDMKNSGVNICTIGQYLQPTKTKIPVKQFITPDEFDKFAAFGKSISLNTYSGPFVRSSYNAQEIFKLSQQKT